jgi:predicted nucleic acid-binding protein
VKILLDACVLFPTVMREVLLGVAAAGLYEPLWSERILEEWVRASERVGEGAFGKIDAAAVAAAFPNALIVPRERDLRRLVLPDENDVHVLAAAIAGSADFIVTLNAKDFPRHTLSAEGVSRQDPDAFLRALWAEEPEIVSGVSEEVRLRAEMRAGDPQPMRALLKRARLPRLAKAVAGQ